jgi:hypothetical protein
MQYGWQVSGYAKILFQVYRHLGMAVKADFEAGAAIVRVVERDVKLFHTLLCAWSRAKGMDIYVKMFSLVYMALTLGVGLVAVSVLFRVCRQRPDEARFRRLGRFFVSYSLVNIILISDFLLRHLFTVRYYFIYSLFLGVGVALYNWPDNLHLCRIDFGVNRFEPAEGCGESLVCGGIFSSLSADSGYEASQSNCRSELGLSNFYV